MDKLTPRKIVQELDKYIVGQGNAKKSVAIALRNRYRRNKLPEELIDEVLPKNILMIGPTGVGKTEIARRIAKLVNAPFVKVEATKFTEVGYVGRDVESMIRDLLETAIRTLKNEKLAQVEEKAKVLAEEKIIELLSPMPLKNEKSKNPFEMIFGGTKSNSEDNQEEQQLMKRIEFERDTLRDKLKKGQLEKEQVEIEVEDNSSIMEVFTGSGMEEMEIQMGDMLGNIFQKKKRHRRVSVLEARRILTQQEAQKLIDMDEIISEALRKAENDGIIFLDEIDKIAIPKGSGSGQDVSRGGVQRDILPIVEGSTVITKYGAVKTDHMLFIAAGAFHMSKPSDLIPELQGRFPIRVELDNLSKEDFLQILTEPCNALIKQYVALLATEGVNIEFSKDSLVEIAQMAYTVNEQTENIGARRLHTIMEKLLEDLFFEGPELSGQTIVIDCDFVSNKLSEVTKDEDLSRYIL